MEMYTSDNKTLCPSCMMIQSSDNGEKCERCGGTLTYQNERYQLSVGHLLANRYLIGKAIGHGGFGITYIAWDMKISKRIAVKEYFPVGLVDRRDGDNGDISVTAGMDVAMFERQKKRFVEEAGLLARFSDEKTVVNISDIVTENSTAYIVMNYIIGETLSDYIKRSKKISFNSAYIMMKPVMETLGHIHSAGLIHRDISPSNLMLQKDGSLILLDFG